MVFFNLSQMKAVNNMAKDKAQNDMSIVLRYL